jgi:hypothetical protein
LCFVSGLEIYYRAALDYRLMKNYYAAARHIIFLWVAAAEQTPHLSLLCVFWFVSTISCPVYPAASIIDVCVSVGFLTCVNSRGTGRLVGAAISHQQATTFYLDSLLLLDRPSARLFFLLHSLNRNTGRPRHTFPPANKTLAK